MPLAPLDDLVKSSWQAYFTSRVRSRGAYESSDRFEPSQRVPHRHLAADVASHLFLDDT